ncbi:MAG: DNA internalization-related competence protein ComEC/Rec2 [Bacteroidetes bacterium]|nr:DNA internalization-related competence protein ComEC/Rec2 [Bacteroidota bacterium]
MTVTDDSYRFPYARYPAVRVVLCLIAGILLSDYVEPVSYAVLAAWIFIWLIAEIVTYQTVRRWVSALVRWLYVSLIILFGLVRAGNYNATEPKPVQLVSGLQGQVITVAGTVRESRLTQNGSLNVVINADSVLAGGYWQEVGIRMQLRAFRADSTLAASVAQNNYVVLKAEIRAFPERRNPKAFDVGRWLRSEGIQVTAQLYDVVSSRKLESRLSWIWWRAGMHNLLDRAVDERVRPLFKAILLGDKGDMDRDVRTAFSRAGLSHLMAVSGMHVGFVLMPIWALIPWFWTNDTGRSLGLVIIASILLFYAGLTGFSSSVSRASITACLLAVGKLFQRNRDSLNTTGVAAIILLVWNPESLFDVGFQMSFVAVCLILVLGPVVRDILPAKMRFGWKGSIILFLGISLIVQAGLFPILAGTFGEFSVAGPIANTVGVPVTQALFLWSMLALPIALLWEASSGWIMMPAEWLASILLWLVEVVGSHDISWMQITEISSFTGVIWFAAAGFIAAIKVPAARFKWLILCLFVLCIIRVEQLSQRWGTPVLRVTVYDVGQGDAVLLQTPSGYTVLYDTGVLSPFQNSGWSVILPDLQARGISHIDAIILSHPHADHIGGMLTLIENLSIGVIYQVPLSFGSAVFAGYMRAAEKAEIPVVEVNSGDVISVDDKIRMLVLHPDVSPLGRDPNAYSVSVKVVYGETSFLLTGDAEMLAERRMADRFGYFLNSDWYKAGHHGSKTSSGERFMNYVSPDLVAVSLGYRNRYRHPHQEATRNMHKFASDVGFTSLHSALIYESDGYTIRRKSF